MALIVRSAASAAALVAVLASPLALAEPARRVDAKAKRPTTAQTRARPQAPSDGTARAWDPNAVVRWEDQDGTVHYTRGYEVPQRFRPNGRKVEATVGTVPMERAAPKTSPASLDASAPAAVPPVTTLPPGPVPPPAGAVTPQSQPSGASQGATTGPAQPTPGAATR